MLIAVVSDSHNNSKSIEVLKEYITKADILLFLGDGEADILKIKAEFKGPIYAVSGNCDIYSKNPEELVLELMGKRIFMCHGHRYNVKYNYDNIYYKGREVGADIILFGHTHIPMIEESDGIIMMNPGSLSRGAGTIGRSLGYIEILDDATTIPYIKELRYK